MVQVKNKRVLAIYTGGTFGMLKNEKGGKKYFELKLIGELIKND